MEESPVPDDNNLYPDGIGDIQPAREGHGKHQGPEGGLEQHHHHGDQQDIGMTLGRLIYEAESAMVTSGWEFEFWSPVAISAIITSLKMMEPLSI